MTTLNVIGCGRVGRTIAALLHRHGLCRVQDLHARRTDSARAAADFIGAGRAVGALADLRPADLWMLSVPDSQVASVAAELAGRTSAGSQADAAPIVFHCSGFLAASALAPLQALGWHAASVHPVLNFAAPERCVDQFPGTPCGMEGDAQATTALEALFSAIGGQCFAVASQAKPLYHAAAVFSSNFAVVLQAIAREAWAEAGVPQALVPRVHEALLRGTVDNLLALGPQGAITGPAARGDKQVVASQGACVSQWHPEAGAVYAQLSALARRLALEGRTLPAPRPAATAP